MGNHLETPDGIDWGRALVAADFTIIRDAGFRTVRIPVRWSAHAQTTAPYTIDAAWMAKVQGIIGWANAAGLNVILDMHHYEELNTSPATQAARFTEMWRQIGAAFSSAPSSIWFELINEPNLSLNDTNLVSILTPALAAIRTTNPTRPVIVAGQNTSGVNSLATLAMPSDPYIVPTFHDYDPVAFTHQGATWIGTLWPIGRTFGSATDVTQIRSNLDKVRAYIARTGRVPFMGEYGAIDLTEVPLSERVKYYDTVSAAYASIGIQSCAWAYTNTFRLREGNAWLPGMLEAVRTTTTQ
ncbi:glycoside hydrolase family 5 [Sphingomonas turrisvirgatae]|uniref:Glycoside hydrolase family 5 n=1 Tax=Sphingomonas turrisvirgatae TaxID=1888892 RepID=A0A1E3LS20_9SPHN|nr:glycoside hydrolase family 5 [Sphingomonas turrisvirgatae]